MTVAMKPFIPLVCAALLGTGLHAQELSSADREALLEKLENMKKYTDATVEARFRVALAAYRQAMCIIRRTYRITSGRICYVQPVTYGTIP